MADIYSTTPYEKRIEAARTAAQSQFGSTDPSAVKAALAEQTFAQDQPFQQAVGEQQASVRALEEMRNYDQQLAGQVNQANQQLQAQQTQLQGQFRQMGRIDPTSTTATTAIGPATFDASQVAAQSTVPGLISPFAASGIATGQTQAALGAFDSASAARAARERLLGTDIAAMAGAYAERLRLEQDEKEDQERKQQQDFDNALALAKLTGQKSFTDPRTGQIHSIQTTSEGSTGVLQKTARSGKTFLDEVTDGLGNFADIIRENPELTRDEIYELARVNAQTFGAFKESPEQLRAMGLSPEEMDQAGVPRQQAGLLDPQQAIQQVISQGGAALLTGKTIAEREAAAQAIMQLGGVEAYRKQVDLPSLLSDKEREADTKIADFSIELQRAISSPTDQEGPGGTGMLAGFVPDPIAGKRTQELRRVISGISSEKIKELSGAAVSTQEAERLRGFLPDRFKSEDQNLADLERLSNGIAMNRELFELAKRNNMTLNEALYQFGPQIFQKYGEEFPYQAGGMSTASGSLDNEEILKSAGY